MDLEIFLVRKMNSRQSESQRIPIPSDYLEPSRFVSIDTNVTAVENTTRMPSMRKYFAIVTCQFAVMVACMVVFLYQTEVKEFAQTSVWLFWVSLIVSQVLLLVYFFCEKLRTTFPANMIFVGLTTVTEGFLLGSISASYEIDELLITFGVCTAVYLALTVFAMQTKWDFTVARGMTVACAVVLLIIVIAAICLQNRGVTLMYCSLAALLILLSSCLPFCLYIY